MELIELINDTLKEWLENDVSEDSIEALEYVRDYLVPIAYGKELDAMKLQLAVFEGECLLHDDLIEKRRQEWNE